MRKRGNEINSAGQAGLINQAPTKETTKRWKHPLFYLSRQGRERISSESSQKMEGREKIC